MESKIVFFATGKFYALASETVREHYPERDILVLPRYMEEAVIEAKRLLDEGRIEIIIAAGASFKMMQAEIDLPVVPIRISGFDLLSVIHEASEHGSKVAVFTHEHKLKEVETITRLLRVELAQRVYRAPIDVAGDIRELMEQGFTTIIGSATINEIAERLGARALLIYRTDAIHQAIELAEQLMEDRRRGLEKDNILRAILEFTSDGIIAINKEGVITAFNPAASSILKKRPQDVIKKEISQVIPNSQLLDVLETGKAQYNEIQTVDGTTIVTNRIPIIVNNTIEGAVATFQDSTTVEQAERVLRRRLHPAEGLAAKTRFEDLVGTSPKFKESIVQAKRFSRTNFTITLIGESGAGKELFAQSIHNASTRRYKPFVAINCAALPEGLLESELFGYEEGAFTGARRGGKPGMFELAHGGTLFLDEVSELSLHLQARLLRVLQEHEIMRLGGKRVTPVDIRIIAATNKNLQELVELKRFRDDLYYRLNVLNLRLCPLRERKDDLFPLFLHFVELMDPVLGQHIRGLEAFVQGQLSRYDWPGNVRELQNFTYRFIVLANPNDAGQVIREQMHRLLENGAALNGPEPQGESLPPLHADRRYRRWSDRDVPRLLEETRGNRSEAARRLGVSRTTLWRWMKTHN